MLDLEPIKSRLSRATPAPWVAVPQTWRSKTSSYTITAYGIEQDENVFNTDASAICYAQREGQLTERNAELIAHAPTDIASLLIEVEKLREACQHIVNACEACEDGYVESSPSGLDAWLPTGDPNIITEPCPYCAPARAALIEG